ncbi:MAG: hypothetical protein ACRD1J_09760 [Terriglobia bacterium]
MPRRLMATAFLLPILCISAVLSGSPNPAAFAQDQGVFILEVAGRRIGTESFEIRSRDSQIEARAEIQIHAAQNGKVSDFRTFPDLILNAALDPVSYTWSQKSPQSSRISIDFKESPVHVRYRTVDGKLDNRTFALPRGVVILDDNVINQYELVARRYLRTPGGKQTFQAFIPQEALPGTLRVTSLGMESIDVGGRKQTAQRLALSTGLAQIDLWVDQEGRLLRMERPSVRFVAFRAR